MAKKTPAPDLNEAAPEAPVDAGVPPNDAGVPFFGSLAVPAGDGKIDFGSVYAENTENAIHSANQFLDEQRPDAKVATLHPTDGSAPISLRTLDDLAKSEGRKILAAGEHTVAAVGQWPTRLEHAIALPLADELDTLHEVEGLVIASFMDVGSVVRKVYLNVLGHFVKA